MQYKVFMHIVIMFCGAYCGNITNNAPERENHPTMNIVKIFPQWSNHPLFFQYQTKKTIWRIINFRQRNIRGEIISRVSFFTCIVITWCCALSIKNNMGWIIKRPPPLVDHYLKISLWCSLLSIVLMNKIWLYFR